VGPSERPLDPGGRFRARGAEARPLRAVCQSRAIRARGIEVSGTGPRSEAPVGYTDDDIIRLCQQGRQEGFALLLDRYQARVYRRAYTFLRHREDVLDATQEVFLRVLQAVRHFQRGRAIWPWLRQVTTNTCLNRLRAAERR